MSGVFCFVERRGEGAAIHRLRLIDAGQERTWSSSSIAAPGAEDQSAVFAGAAEWLAQQVDGSAPLTICIDLDGGRCAWLTAPGAEQSVVKATIRAQALAVGDESVGAMTGGSGSGAGAIWAPDAGEVDVDLSVQSLAATERVHGRQGRRMGKAPAAVAPRQRLAVLAVPDLAARVLLDELDKRGVVVEAVISLWHAMALAWDPARADDLRPGHLTPGQDDALDVRNEPATAVVIVEASGRLAWSWSVNGRLLAGGMMRLRRNATPRPDSSVPTEGDSSESTPAEVSVVEVSRSEVGRIVSEWLAWGAQLGAVPVRVVCLGPVNITCAGLDADLPGVMGVGAVARSLAAAWPGASATAAVEEDPIGATLSRLAAGREGLPVHAGDVADPRIVLADLTARPGRRTKALYRWSAGAIAAAAIGVGVLGWKIEQGATATAQLAREATSSMQAILSKPEVLAVAESVVRSPNSAPQALRSKLAELRNAKSERPPEPPILLAMTRLLTSTQEAPGTQLNQLELNFANVNARFIVKDAAAGPKMLAWLQDPSRRAGVEWSGQTAISNGEQRMFQITGSWAREEARPAAPAPTPAPDKGPA